MIAFINATPRSARSAIEGIVVAHAGRVGAPLFPIKMGYGEEIRVRCHQRRLSCSTSDTRIWHLEAPPVSDAQYTVSLALP